MRNEGLSGVSLHRLTPTLDGRKSVEASTITTLDSNFRFRHRGSDPMAERIDVLPCEPASPLVIQEPAVARGGTSRVCPGVRPAGSDPKPVSTEPRRATQPILIGWPMEQLAREAAP